MDDFTVENRRATEQHATLTAQQIYLYSILCALCAAATAAAAATYKTHIWWVRSISSHLYNYYVSFSVFSFMISVWCVLCAGASVEHYLNMHVASGKWHAIAM